GSRPAPRSPPGTGCDTAARPDRAHRPRAARPRARRGRPRRPVARPHGRLPSESAPTGPRDLRHPTPTDAAPQRDAAGEDCVVRGSKPWLIDGVLRTEPWIVSRVRAVRGLQPRKIPTGLRIGDPRAP